MAYIQVVALGPDNRGFLTFEAAQVLQAADRVIVRTQQHDTVVWMREQGIAFESLDYLYEQSYDFDTFKQAVADAVQQRMESGIQLCYAVAEPQTDETVSMLADLGVPLKVYAGVTHASDVQAKVLEAGISAQGGVCIIPAMSVQSHRINPAMTLVITEMDNRLLAGEVKLALLTMYPPDMQVFFAGTQISLEALDRQTAYDHLSKVYVPACTYANRSRYVFDDLLTIMARLRDPIDGCPWDIKQTHASLRQYVIEEAYEVVEAIDRQDSMRIADELGDVLLQVVFHAQVAKDHGEFDIGDVTTAICSKMISRHAHIFGDVQCETADDVLRSWEAIKKKEKGLASNADSMRDIPMHMPALMRAFKVQAKAKRMGLPWGSTQDALDKLQTQCEAVRQAMISSQNMEGELGELLFCAVNVARTAGIEPELSLLKAIEKFIVRFALLEQIILEAGKQLTDMAFEEVQMLWQQIIEQEVND